MESSKDFGFKVGIYSCLNENMKIYEYRRSRSLTFDQGLFHADNVNMSSKATGPVETKFHKETPGMEETKICSNTPGHMINMFCMTIYGKNH